MQLARSGTLPSYTTPPVNEVAIGIGFAPLACWDVLAPAAFREMVKDRYPKVEERAPLPPMRVEVGQTIQQMAMPPMRRIWYLSEDKRTLIQLQADRLHVNWRKLEETDVYPRYDNVLVEFELALTRLLEFVESQDEDISMQDGEVTYLNHIPKGALWSDLGDLSKLFASWSPVPIRAGKVDGIACSAVLTREGIDNGDRSDHNLTIELQNALKSDTDLPLLVLQLIGRGKLPAGGFDDISTWFGSVSEDIVKTFTEITSEYAHSAWGRTR